MDNPFLPAEFKKGHEDEKHHNQRTLLGALIFHLRLWENQIVHLGFRGILRRELRQLLLRLEMRLRRSRLERVCPLLPHTQCRCAETLDGICAFRGEAKKHDEICFQGAHQPQRGSVPLGEKISCEPLFMVESK